MDKVRNIREISTGVNQIEVLHRIYDIYEQLMKGDSHEPDMKAWLDSYYSHRDRVIFHCVWPMDIHERFETYIKKLTDGRTCGYKWKTLHAYRLGLMSKMDHVLVKDVIGIVKKHYMSHL